MSISNSIYEHFMKQVFITPGNIAIEYGEEIYEDNYNDETVIIKGNGKCITPIVSLQHINNSQLLWKATIDKSKLDFIVEVTIYV
ncbi:hypothetical protein WL523_11855 [Staphylococcus warneri]|uniref:hypothetical protein n=1 Tax=Staphylococcus warneri TaxID=1292 RepID=UPI00138AD1F4